MDLQTSLSAAHKGLAVIEHEKRTLHHELEIQEEKLQQGRFEEARKFVEVV